MAMQKEKVPFTPPNTEPHPIRDEEDLAEDLDKDEDESYDEEADTSGLGPRG
jgi:hypothetical protein